MKNDGGKNVRKHNPQVSLLSHLTPQTMKLKKGPDKNKEGSIEKQINWTGSPTNEEGRKAPTTTATEIPTTDKMTTEEKWKTEEEASH